MCAWRALAELTVCASMIANAGSAEQHWTECMRQARTRPDHEIDCVSERHSAAEYEPAIVSANAAALRVHTAAKLLLFAALDAADERLRGADIAPAVLDLWNAAVKYERHLRAVRRVYRGSRNEIEANLPKLPEGFVGLLSAVSYARGCVDCTDNRSGCTEMQEDIRNARDLLTEHEKLVAKDKLAIARGGSRARPTAITQSAPTSSKPAQEPADNAPMPRAPF